MENFQTNSFGLAALGREVSATRRAPAAYYAPARTRRDPAPTRANDFHRCCGLMLLRTTVPRSILQMKIPDRVGEGGRGPRG